MFTRRTPPAAGQDRSASAEPGGEILAEGIPVSFDGTVQPVEANGIRLAAGLRDGFSVLAT
jgi:hypothetical protein